MKRKLNERSPKPAELMAKLEALKESGDYQPGELDKFVTLLSKILDDKVRLSATLLPRFFAVCR